MFRFLVLLAVLAAPLSAQDIKVASYTLSNGMKILVHEDHDVPNVSLYFFYKIGSRNERPGATGISHFFEHMMFNGAKKYGPGQFDFQMEKAGGRNNAYTTENVTVYTDWFPTSALDLMFDMESDRIRDLSFDPKIIESERGVVYSERRTSVDNNPMGTLDEQFTAAAFIAHPYHWPVIGWASDIESWTMDDLKAHFKMGYAPNNCLLVATGDVTPQQILALARKYLEPIPSQPPPPPIRTREPEQLGERRVVVRRPANLPILMVGFHVGATRDPESVVWDLLEAILTTGRSSRLYQRLVEKDQLVLNVRGGATPSLDPGLFSLAMQVRSGKSPAAVETALYDELDRLAREGVTPAELNKARNQILANFYRGLKTIAGKANLLGTYEVFYGDWSRVNQVAAALDKVQPEDVQRVAKKIFTDRNRTVATLIPDTPQEASK
jgi:zinc protease